MKRKIEFTYEGLQKAKPHLVSQLKKLDDTDLWSIRLGCEGRFRTRNSSMLVNLSGCGRSDVEELWERDGGRMLIITSIQEILNQRRHERLDESLRRNVLKLA